MLDWQVYKDSHNLPEWLEEEELSVRSRPYFFVGLLFLLLIVVAGGAFYWRVSERTEAMEGDLTAFVGYEEQQRFFGLREGNQRLLVSGVPKAWQRAYLDTFAVPDEARPIEIEVEEIEFDGTSALVTVEIDGYKQVRFYRSLDQRWRRAPLPSGIWGERRTVRLPNSKVTIAYYERDESFVLRLVDELPLLLENWPSNSTIERLVIEHEEFGKPLLAQNDKEVVLNSPLLVPLPSSDEFGGEALLRMIVADTLLAEAYSEEQATRRLEGAFRFRAASRMTLMLYWALPPTLHQDLRETWIAAVKGRWRSPFLGRVPDDKRFVFLDMLWQLRSRDATIQLVTDYLYEQYGADALIRLASQSLSAASWDRLFQPVVKVYTIQLEREVRADYGVDRANQPQVELTIELPSPATVLDSDPQIGSLSVQVPSSEHPLSIDAITAKVIDPTGKSLPNGCAGLYKDITILQGDWLILGEALKAREIQVRELSPFLALPSESTPAPPDTFAYLAAEGSSKEDWRLMALQEDGSSTHLTTFPSALRPLEGAQMNNLAVYELVLYWNVWYCEQAWLFRYDPQQGFTNQWLTAPEWRFAQGQITARETDTLLFVMAVPHNRDPNAADSNWRYAQLDETTANEPLIYPTGSLQKDWEPLGWRAASKQLVVLDASQQQKQVRLVNFASAKAEETIALASEPGSFLRLSQDGEQLLYIEGWHPKLSDQRALHLVTLSTAEDRVLMRMSEEERTWPVHHEPSFNQLLLFNGPIEQPIAKRLLLLNPSSPDSVTVIAEGANDEALTSALLCSDERILYTVKSEVQSELWLWQPKGLKKRLLTSQEPLNLLSCR